MDKEQRWLQKRLGMITASEVGELTSTSGKIIDGTVSYIRKKRFERVRGYALPVSARAMDIGNETEPMIAEWLKANREPDIIYSKDLPEIPFWIAPDCPLGASPDGFIQDETVVFEMKTLVGNEATEFFMDNFTSMEEKRARVWKEHGDQLLAQFISNPKVKSILLVKYAPQRDDIMADTDNPLASWRGVTFTFSRHSFEESIAELKDRIILIDAMIDAPINPSEFKKGEWYITPDKQLRKK